MTKDIGVVAALLLCGCLTEDQYWTMAKNAATCSEGDACVVTSYLPNSCTCTAVVRSTEAADIEGAARRVFCGGKMVKCVAWTNPRCEAGVCVADPPH